MTSKKKKKARPPLNIGEANLEYPGKGSVHTHTYTHTRVRTHVCVSVYEYESLHPVVISGEFVGVSSLFLSRPLWNREGY